MHINAGLNNLNKATHCLSFLQQCRFFILLFGKIYEHLETQSTVINSTAEGQSTHLLKGGLTDGVVNDAKPLLVALQLAEH